MTLPQESAVIMDLQGIEHEIAPVKHLLHGSTVLCL